MLSNFQPFMKSNWVPGENAGMTEVPSGFQKRQQNRLVQKKTNYSLSKYLRPSLLRKKIPPPPPPPPEHLN